MLHCLARHCVNTLTQPPAELSNISAVLFSNSGLVPLRNRPYELQSPDGTVLKGTTDGDAYLEHRDVPAGDYVLRMDGISGWVPTTRNAQERLPIRVRGYYLVHRPEQASSAERPKVSSSTPAEDEENWEPLDPADQEPEQPGETEE